MQLVIAVYMCCQSYNGIMEMDLLPACKYAWGQDRKQKKNFLVVLWCVLIVDNIDSLTDFDVV